MYIAHEFTGQSYIGSHDPSGWCLTTLHPSVEKAVPVFDCTLVFLIKFVCLKFKTLAYFSFENSITVPSWCWFIKKSMSRWLL